MSEQKGPEHSQMGYIHNRCSRCPHGATMHEANGHCLAPDCECPGYEPDLTEQVFTIADDSGTVVSTKSPVTKEQRAEFHRTHQYQDTTPKELTDSWPEVVEGRTIPDPNEQWQDVTAPKFSDPIEGRGSLVFEKSEVLRTSHQGEHYHDFAIEPIQYIEANHLNFHQGNIVKYVSRYQLKNGVDDLKKALFYLRRLIEITEAEE